MSERVVVDRRRRRRAQELAALCLCLAAATATAQQMPTPASPQAPADAPVLTLSAYSPEGAVLLQAAGVDGPEDQVGVFNGRRFREEIYPRVRAFIRRMEGALEKARDAA